MLCVYVISLTLWLPRSSLVIKLLSHLGNLACECVASDYTYMQLSRIVGKMLPHNLSSSSSSSFSFPLPSQKWTFKTFHPYIPLVWSKTINGRVHCSNFCVERVKSHGPQGLPQILYSFSLIMLLRLVISALYIIISALWFLHFCWTYILCLVQPLHKGTLKFCINSVYTDVCHVTRKTWMSNIQFYKLIVTVWIQLSLPEHSLLQNNNNLIDGDF